MADSILIDKAWLRVKAPESSLGEKAAAYFVTNFLPIVPILTALSTLGSLASGSAAIAKPINNARMAKEDMEEKKRHNRKIESVAVGGELYHKPYRKGYVFFLKSYSNGKGIKKRKN